MQESNKEISINNIIISNERPFTLIAGPCVLESYDHAMHMATKLKDITDKLGICLLYTSPSPRDGLLSRMPSSA